MARKRYEFDTFLKENEGRLREIWLNDERYTDAADDPRPVRRRPRLTEEADVLTLLAQARLERALQTGELEILGPRRYRLHVFK